MSIAQNKSSLAAGTGEAVKPVDHGRQVEPGLTENGDGITHFVTKATVETLATGSRVVLPNNAGTVEREGFLRSISYCYAKGIFDSEEVREQMQRISPEQGEQRPDAAAIRRFRRLNREVILSVLELVFRWRRYLERGRQNPFAAPPVSLVRPVSESTGFIVRREAEQRLESAIIVDSNCRDDM